METPIKTKHLAPTIRVGVRAVIEHQGCLLVQHKVYEDGTERYTLPGGGLDLGETLAQGLKRECREEIGCDIEILDLLHVADYFKPRDTSPQMWRQQVETLFRCQVPDDYTPQNGPQPDKHQKDVVWMDITDLRHKGFTPAGLSAILAQSIPSNTTYLGRID